MLTPKDKAIKLYSKFFNNAESRNKIGLYDEDLHKYNTKRCALIAIDEILEVLESIDTPTAVALCYWYHEVKQEIANL